MRLSKAGFAGALTAAVMAVGVQASPSLAAGLPLSAQALSAPPAATQVDWRGHRWDGGRGFGPGIGLGIIGGVIIGGALIANAVAEHRADDGAMRACARDFRGFDWRTGTFVDNYGHVRICPYLQ